MIFSLILAAAQAASPPAAPAREIWCRGVAIETRDGARARVIASFETHRNRPGTTDPEEALDFLRRAETGEFGPLRIRPLISPIDTLPADGC